MEATQDTHRQTHAGLRSLLNVRSAFDPSRTILPPGPSRSSGQLLSARGPSEPSVSVTDGQENVLVLHVFPVGVLIGGNPTSLLSSPRVGPGYGLCSLSLSLCPY